MDAKEKTRRHFDETAADYNNSSDGKFVQPMYQSLVDEIVRTNGGRLLDVGCGNGNLFGLIQRDKLQLYGIDLSEKMIDEAKAAYADVAALSVSDAEQLPYGDGMFDILVCNASFHHYTHPETVLAEMNRVLRLGGTLLLGDPYMPQPFRWLGNAFTRYSDEGDFHYYGIREMTSLFNAHGFGLSRASRTGNHSILYVAVKTQNEEEKKVS